MDCLKSISLHVDRVLFWVGTPIWEPSIYTIVQGFTRRMSPYLWPSSNVASASGVITAGEKLLLWWGGERAEDASLFIARAELSREKSVGLKREARSEGEHAEPSGDPLTYTTGNLNEPVRYPVHKVQNHVHTDDRIDNTCWYSWRVHLEHSLVSSTFGIYPLWTHIHTCNIEIFILFSPMQILLTSMDDK